MTWEYKKQISLIGIYSSLNNKMYYINPKKIIMVSFNTIIDGNVEMCVECEEDKKCYLHFKTMREAEEELFKAFDSSGNGK